MYTISRFFIVFLFASLLNAHSATLFVSPKGDDANAGSKQKPVASIQRAVDLLRESPEKSDAKEIRVLPGVYSLNATIVLDQRDNGLTVQAQSGGVRVIGGKTINGFKSVENDAILKRLPEAARGHVMQCDLKGQGITDFGELQLRGFGRPGNPSAMELFIDGEAMTLARWPNEGWAKIADAPNGNEGGMFTFEGEQPAKWMNAPDVWLHGYWSRDWADSYVKVKRIAPDEHAIYTEEPHGVYGYTKGKRWYALNLLEELDAAGEYYIDRESGVLYVWPKKSLKNAEVFVSTLEQPLVQIKNAKNVKIVGLTLECSRGDGVEVRDSESIQIAGCTLRNLGQRGVSINGGKLNSVLSCDIYDVVEGGIALNGGDRKTLAPANHSAVNNDIYRYARCVRTYRPAISLQGVGNRIAHNRIHDGPHTGVLFGGNDHILENNEVYNLCWESGDVGAFYIGRDWTMRGHLVQHNYFHEINGPHTYGAQCIYLDDAASGVTIKGNIFQNSGIGAFIGGGRDNRVENNLMVDCDYATHIDKRGEGWANKHIVKGGEWRMYEKLDDVKYNQPPYSERYPTLANLLDDRPNYPVGSVFANNVSYSKKWMRNQSVNEEDLLLKDNFIAEPTDEINWRKSNFQLPKDHPALKTGYQQIPFDKIGLYKDQNRKELPK
ncbi:MAG: right-handed parallel beta-helix repeat-containing protein [Candidatus Hinthialibacter antarcticus]|nr:right-handed parallel beta-helix repeat-containing protein [Candidatus Hinthialibacter antarcticus]